MLRFEDCIKKIKEMKIKQKNGLTFACAANIPGVRKAVGVESHQ